MRSRFLIQPLIVALVAATAVTAQAFTFASFADPTIGSPSPTPMFFVTPATGNGTISGGWSGTGLTLKTWTRDFSDVIFVMGSTATTQVGAGIYTVGSGSVVFSNTSESNLFTITFGSGTLSPNGVGGSDFTGSNVTFSGFIAGGTYTDEAFAFTFANPNETDNGITYTASFTSSAVPEPASVAAMALGLAALPRKRRK